jgi:phosphatidylinositol-3-phosphatase
MRLFSGVSDPTRQGDTVSRPPRLERVELYCDILSLPIITEENHSYEDVVGNSQMPYYSQLLNHYGLATQFYANQHNSLPASMWLVAGAPVGANNDTVSYNHGNDNIVRELLKHGYTWRYYQETMPYAGFQELYGGTNNSYYRRHNPLIDFSDVCPGTGQDK